MNARLNIWRLGSGIYEVEHVYANMYLLIIN